MTTLVEFIHGSRVRSKREPLMLGTVVDAWNDYATGSPVAVVSVGWDFGSSSVEPADNLELVSDGRASV